MIKNNILFLDKNRAILDKHSTIFVLCLQAFLTRPVTLHHFTCAPITVYITPPRIINT